VLSRLRRLFIHKLCLLLAADATAVLLEGTQAYTLIPASAANQHGERTVLEMQKDAQRR
jgi:hypothetical protein